MAAGAYAAAGSEIPAACPTPSTQARYSWAGDPQKTTRQKPIGPHQHRGLILSNLSHSCAAADFAASDKSRKLFVRMMWKAFPMGSEAAIAERAAPVLGLTERHVQRLLAGEHDPKAKHFLAVALILFGETALTRFYGDG